MYLTTSRLTEKAEVALSVGREGARLRVTEGTDVLVIHFENMQALERFYFSLRTEIVDHMRTWPGGGNPKPVDEPKGGE